jgi:hypothetical protein
VRCVSGDGCTGAASWSRLGGSWLNLVEVFFGIITGQAIRRGTFTSVKDLTTAIGRFIDGWNERCHPLTWTKTAADILPHTRRQRASDAGH